MIKTFASSFVLIAAMGVVSGLHPQASSPTKSVVRETTGVEVGGLAEDWRLEWESTPKWTCGPSDPESNTSPCSGFAYGQSGILDLIQSRKKHDVETFHLTPLFGDDAPVNGEATLQYGLLRKRSSTRLVRRRLSLGFRDTRP